MTDGWSSVDYDLDPLQRPTSAPPILDFPLCVSPHSTSRCRPRTAMKTRFDHATTPRGGNLAFSPVPLYWRQPDRLPVATTRYNTQHVRGLTARGTIPLQTQLNDQVR